MSYNEYDDTNDRQQIIKSSPASIRQLRYFCHLAEQEGMDGEDLASLHFGKDVIDLTEDEVSTLIADIMEE